MGENDSGQVTHYGEKMFGTLADAENVIDDEKLEQEENKSESVVEDEGQEHIRIEEELIDESEQEEEKKYKCLYPCELDCDSNFTETELKRHMRDSHDKPITNKCDYIQLK